MAHSTESETFIIVFMRNILVYALITAACLAISVLYLREAKYKYEVTMEISSFSIQEGTKQGPSLSGPAFLGLNDDDITISQPFGVYLRHLTSHTTALKLYQNEDLLRNLFPGRWDTKQETWVNPPSLLGDVRTRIHELVSYPHVAQPKPSVGELRSFLERKIRVEEVDRSLRTVSIHIGNPETGVELLDQLHRVADENARDFVRESSIERLSLLEKRYDQTPASELRINLGNMLQHYTRTLIMTDGGKNFAAEQFQAPVYDSSPSTPKPKIILALAVAFGFIIFLLLKLIRTNSANQRERVLPAHSN